jgi:hypothetical protein
MQGCGCGLPAYVGGIPHSRGFPQGGFPPTMGTIGSPMGTPPDPLAVFQGGDAGGPPLYRAPPAMNGRYGPTGGYGMLPGHPGMSPGVQANVQSPYSNVAKRYFNWNACYLCSFEISNGHTSMCARPMCVRQHIRSGLIARMPNNILAWGIHALPATGTRHNS